MYCNQINIIKGQYRRARGEDVQYDLAVEDGMECWRWDEVLDMRWSVGDRIDCEGWDGKWEKEGMKNLLSKILLNIAWLRQGKYTLGSDMN